MERLFCPKPYLSDYGNSSDGLVNKGRINAGVSGGQFYIYGNKFTSQGSIAVSNVDTLDINSKTFANAGSISVTGSGVFDLRGTATTAGFGGITASSGGVVQIDGLLTNAGATLNVGTGSALGKVKLVGTIQGRTIHDAGSGFSFNGGILDGVTYQGTIDMSAASANLRIADAITLTGTGGAGAGTVHLTGAGSELLVAGTTTLNSATIDIGNNSSYDYLFAYDSSGTGAVLTLGANLVVTQTGTYVYGPGTK